MLNDPHSVNPQPFWANVADFCVQVVVSSLPQVPVFNCFKAALMRMRGARVGKDIKILPGVWIDRFSGLQIGDEVSVATGVVITTAGGVNIGDHCMIGYRAVLLSAHHVIPPGRKPMRYAGARFAPLVVERDAWIGAGAVLLGGVTVGEGAVIGANALVNRDIPPFAVAAGVPARVLRMRD